MKRFGFFLAILTGALVLAVPTWADTALSAPCTGTSTLVCSASSGALNGQVTFTINGSGQLVVTMTNLSTTQVANPGDVLTAAFFNTGGATLAPVSGVGSQINVGGAVLGTGVNVGNFWAYSNNLGNGTPGGQADGLSGVGFGLFGPHDIINGTVPGQPGGVAFGIANSGFDGSGCGSNDACTVPLIVNSATFTFNVSPGFSLTSVSGVSLAWGTTVRAAEPGSLWLLGAGFAGLLVLARRKFSSP